MIISEIKPEVVFETLSIGETVICIDFKKGEYMDLIGQSVSRILRLTKSDTCLFFVTKEFE